MDTKENKLTIKICNSKPIELIDFTECFLGVGQQYIRFLTRNPEVAEAKDIRLFIKEVRPGSTIADLIPLAPYALPFIQNVNSIIGFSRYMHDFTKYLLGAEDRPKNIEKPDFEQFNKITMPVSKDNSSQFNLTAVVNGGIHQTFNFGHLEANAMQNTIAREIATLAKPIERLQKKVLLYWYQARNDPKSKVGDKAIIESITTTPLKTIFAFDSLKHEMLFVAQDNPFYYAYIVDVVVDTIQERPVTYKIVEFYEKFQKPNIEQDGAQKSLFTT